MQYAPIILIGDTSHTELYRDALSTALAKYHLSLTYYRDIRQYIFGANPMQPAVFLLDVDGLHDPTAVIEAIDTSPYLAGSAHYLLCEDTPKCGDCSASSACQKMYIKFGVGSHFEHVYQMHKHSETDSIASKIQWVAAKVAAASVGRSHSVSSGPDFAAG